MKKKYFFYTVLILIGTLLFSVAPAHTRLVANHSDGAFDDGDTGAEGANLTCLSIGELIIKGKEGLIGS